MSNIPIKDASDATRKVDVITRTEGADTVETQAVAVVDGTTGTQVDFATQATTAALLTAAQAIRAAIESLNGKATTIDTSAVAGSVSAQGAPSGFYPGYFGPTSEDNRPLRVDEANALVTRSAVLTDEGTFRANFANASIESTIGSVTVVSTVVTGSGFLNKCTAPKDYFKLDADPESAWTQILSMDSDTQLTLVEPYKGAGTSGAASRTVMKPITGAGGSITVANGKCTLSSGTTNGAVTGITRKLDYCPITFRAAVSATQRIANQDIVITLQEDATVPRWFSEVRLTGTNASQVLIQAGRNPTGAPSAFETEQLTVTLPDGLGTVDSLEFTVEMLPESNKYFVNNRAAREAKPILLGELSRVIPVQYDVVACAIFVINGTGVASSTNVVIDYATGQNHNIAKIGTFSNTETFVAAPAPISEFSKTLTGLGTILAINCSQYRQLSVTVSGTNTGTVVFEVSDEPTFANAQAIFGIPTAGGTPVSQTTSTSKVSFTFAPMLPHFRARTSAGGTAVRTAVIHAFAQPTQALQANVTLAANTAVNVATNATGSGGATNTKIISAANTNGISVKATAGCINLMSLENLSASLKFAKVYSKATAPIVGTDTPVHTYAIQPNSSRSIDCGSGLRIGTGIGIGITGGYADNDTTAPAVGDVIVNISYT